MGDELDEWTNSVTHTNALEELGELPDDAVHAIVTDPPYGIEFTGEDWDTFRERDGEIPDDVDLSDTPFESGIQGEGNMYEAWCTVWATQARHALKPGGHVVAFSSNTTHHRLMRALERAGYEIRDTITWHYAEGIPKGSSLSTWLDGEDAEKWGDWRGTLSPATEFAVLARSPLDGRSATQNQVDHGVGNLNVEEARLSSGRFPVNVALDEVMAELMDLQSGEREGCQPHAISENRDETVYDAGYSDSERFEGYDDSGGASRFFYCSKASKSERTHNGTVDNDHPTVKPLDLMRWLVKLVTDEGQVVCDPFAGSGTTPLACVAEDRDWVAFEKSEDYVTIAQNRIDNADEVIDLE